MRSLTGAGIAAVVAVLASASPNALAAPAAGGKPGTSPEAATKAAACIKALDAAQESRANRKLLDARTSYVACSNEACPDMVRDDCSKGLREVDEALPTLVLSASVDGKDATDASVVLDGERLAQGLDGRAISVDPGPHLARFERPGSAVVEVKVVAREGEKNRLVNGVFALPHGQGGVKAEGQHFPVVPVAFAATGALALSVALVEHLSMTSRANDLGKECAPNCAQTDRDALSDRLVLRNVALGVGLGALAVAAVTYVVGLRR
jgi:hypothetical protein